jgi:hypothetical protein
MTSFWRFSASVNCLAEKPPALEDVEYISDVDDVFQSSAGSTGTSKYSLTVSVKKLCQMHVNGRHVIM